MDAFMILNFVAPFLLAFAAQAVGEAPVENPEPATSAQEEDARSGWMVPIEGLEVGMYIPENERLVYLVELDVAVVGKINVGSFVITSQVDDYRAGLPKLGGKSEEPRKRKGHIRGEAAGRYLNYTLGHSIDARILPQVWPHVIVRDYQTGTENRRREVMYGTREGKPMSWYRRDRHCKGCDRREHFVEGRLSIITPEHHCDGCNRLEHREWDEPKVQAIPEGALDMLSSIFVARELVVNQGGALDFPLLDKDSWWNLTMTLGDEANIRTPLGKFACQAVKLDPKIPEGEEPRKDFKGLFGIHGTLSIWLHKKTGVPVKIEGIVPLGPMDLDVAIILQSTSGEPEGFAPLEE
ncbi:MAG: DUF3108 domain-containing protein [Planctomycetes bacterium]|nr:DUF3108 domain-containing protein [Planctomycetota bacterium]